MEDMINISYTCDLCGEECNNNTFKIPVAATFTGKEPCDLVPVDMNLCKKCRNEIYKVMIIKASEERIKNLNQLAIDIKMGRYDE